MYLSWGVRSKCCYAPIRLGKKKVKNTNLSVNIWICTKCKRKDVDTLQYTKDGPPKSTNWDVDTEAPDLIE